LYLNKKLIAERANLCDNGEVFRNIFMWLAGLSSKNCKAIGTESGPQPGPERACKGLEALSNELTEEQRLIEAAQRDPEAFGAIYDRYFDRIYAYAYHHTGQQADAEDVTAQTFKQAFENIGRFQWRGVPFGAWLYRIASNVMTGQLRKRRPTASFEEAIKLPGENLSPEDSFLTGERNAELLAQVRRLPEYQRQAILLRFGQNLSYAEIARSINRTEGAVKQLIHRALVTLRENMNQSSSADSTPLN
jgi:RNA polymerase sigma-70 factor, ECF subfamily